MKTWSLIALVLLAVLITVAGVNFLQGKEEQAMNAEERSHVVPMIDVQSDVSFETATFSLG